MFSCTFRRSSILLACALAPFAVRGAAQSFSISQALSAPFMNQLTAAPAKGRVAWFADAEGVRNVWVASATEADHAVTHYREDDGQDIDGIVWSPDGETVAYVRGTGPEGSEHPTAANPAHLQSEVEQQVAVATVGGAVRVIGQGHGAVFSQDGKHLFFIRHSEIWSADLSKGDSEPVQLVRAKGSAGSLRPSPDGSKLAFVSSRGDHSFIGVFHLAEKSLSYVDPGTGLDHDPVWSADSRRIAFIRESPVVTELDLRWMQSVPVPWSIRIADVRSGNGEEVWHADRGTGSLFHEVVAKNQLLWMADGRIVFPWEKSGWLHLYSLAPDAKSAVELTPGNFEVDNVVTDGRRVLYSSNGASRDKDDIDRKHLWSIAAAGGRPERLTSGETIETNPALLSDGTVAAMLGSAQQPFAPVLVRESHGTCNITGRRLDPLRTDPDDTRCGHIVGLLSSSQKGGAAREHFVTPTGVVFPATDGLQIHAQLMLPKGARPADKLPTVVFFHGGSRRQMLLGYNPMQYYAQTYEMNQYLVSQGYAVLSVNYRSGIGYGMQFRQAPHYGVFGGSEYFDVEGAVKWLKAQPFVDVKRIGVWGGSYGGYLTAMALARDSADFAAGVDLHGVHDWSYEMDMWKPTDDPAHNTGEAAKVAYTASPMADVGRWRSPVLLMQGDDDRNVLFGQTVRLAAELRGHGVEVEEKIFPDEVHDFLLHRNWVTAFELAADFFDRRLKRR